MRRASRIIFTSLLSFILAAQPVTALTLEVSDNGGGSSNEVQVTQETNVNINQTNEGEVINQVDTAANTGSNEASENTGEETAITTGDVSQSVSVENQLNVSEVSGQCCPGEAELVISGNGADSQNTINRATSSTTSVVSSNMAVVTNSIEGEADTGNNTALNNGGKVAIDTGNILVEARGQTKANSASIKMPSGGGAGVSARISGNGADSDNQLILAQVNLWNALVNNMAYITNNIDWQANTGGNTANGNSGDVLITSGDILLSLNVENNANTAEVEVSCCPEEEELGPVPSPPPGPSPSPYDPGDRGNGGNGGNGGGDEGNGEGEVLGAMGEILPATGSEFLLWATVANIVLLFLGLYLRTPQDRQLRLVISFS